MRGAYAAFAPGNVARARTADPRRRGDTGSLNLCDQLFDGPPRRRLNDDKVDHHDAEQRGNDQQQATGNVSEHD